VNHTPSPDALRERLAQALGSRFVLLRELAHGGMSRVFLGAEPALGRQVVIKLLPHLGGQALGRFRQEMRVAARLQHPLIVPVLQAGEVDGLPWYAMPYVEGEALRERLLRGPLPVREAAGIIADVADALAAAHARGVVHRDVKPGNVLMSEGHALLTDFGVAKAVQGEAATGASATDTGVGLAIGTPAYMSPEQAAGDADVDHRADLYALGVLAYELLAGRTPFVERSAQKLLVAHLTVPPQPIEELRPDLPPGLAALVMRLLAKRPEERPASAAEVRDAVQSHAATPSGEATVARPVPRRRRGALLAGAAALVVAAGALAYARLADERTVDENLVAVAPFRTAGADPSLAYLREGMVDLLAATLTGEGGPRSVEPRAFLSAWRRAARGEAADVPRDRALELAERLGAGRLLVGSVAGTPARLRFEVTLLRVEDGRAELQARIDGPADSLPQLVDRLTRELLARTAGSGDRTTALASAPLPAVRAYLDGRRLYRQARFEDAAEAFDRALDLDSTFAPAALELISAASWYGDPAHSARGSAVLERAVAQDGLAERDRLVLESLVGPRFPVPSPSAELIAASERLTRHAPESPEAWFWLGDRLMHFGADVDAANWLERSRGAFRRALALDSAFAPAIEHLLLIEARAGDTAAVRRLFALYQEHDSAGEDLDGLRWRLAALEGDTATLRALRRRATDLSAISAHTIADIAMSEGVDVDGAEEIWERRRRAGVAGPAPTFELLFAHDIALNRGRVARADAILDEVGDSHGALHFVSRERIRDALFWDGDTSLAAAAVRTLEAHAAAASDTALPAPDRAADQCVLGLWRAARGAVGGARRAADGVRALGAASPLPESMGCAPALDAMIASIERRPDRAAAIARLDSALAAGPGYAAYAGNLVLARLLEAEGDVAGALRAVRRRDFLLGRQFYLSTYLREEGRLAALAGERRAALAAYRHYLALRASPDAALRDDVGAVRAEVARLERELR
jgi:serine/threonine-protein kinase